MKNKIIRSVLSALFIMKIEICLNSSDLQNIRYECWLTKHRIFGDRGAYWSKRIFTIQEYTVQNLAMLLSAIAVMLVFFILLFFAALW